MDGQLKRAAQLMGAAEALREEIHAPIQPSNRVHYEQMMALGRGGVAEEQFAQWWALGWLMTYEAAVAEALKG